MKNFLLFLLIIVSFGSFSQSIQDELNYFSRETDKLWNERIFHFHSDIKVQKDCRVLITEKIAVNVLGEEFKRGIFREIPLSYEYNGGNYHVLFDLIDVKRNGSSEPFKTENASNGIRIYIGQESVFLDHGVHIFEISYYVSNVLGFYDNHDELFWNVNGNGWEMSIDSISATMYYPEGAKYMRHNGFTGSYGSTNKDFIVQKNEGSITFIGTSELGRNECLSIAVGWNKNQLIYPTFWENIIFFISIYAVWFAGILGIVIGLSFNFFMWKKYGADPKPGTIIPRFYPPNGMTPAECAYLKNEGRETDTMFGSMLLYLGSKGWIEISKEANSKYHLTKVVKDDKKKDLNEIGLTFYHQMMHKDNVYFVKDTYNERLSEVSDGLTSIIDKKQTGEYYVRNSFLARRQFAFPLLTLAMGALALYLFGGSMVVLIGAVALHIGINLFFSRLYEQPTKKGRQATDEIQGFMMYMRYANKERIKLMNPPSMDFNHFEENLSYAVALGIAKEWAGQFDQETLREANHGGMPYMHGILFMNYASFGSFGNEISDVISSAQIPPTSSGGFSGGGGGGFSGGGGSSGGGFGGGGGGGW